MGPTSAPFRVGIHVKSRFETPLAIAALVGLILAAFWKLTLMKGVVITDDVFASDLMNENFPYRVALGEALRAGHWPLWVREIYGGFPLLARSEAGVCYPFNIVLFGLLPPYVALNLTILLTLIIAAVGMYLYAREIGGDVRAGLLGGTAFAFSGFLMAHMKHLSMANGASWLPLGLLLLERAVVRRSRRPLVWFAVVFGLQHLSGNAQVAYYCGALYLLYFPLRLLNHRGASDVDKVPLGRAFACFAAALALGSLLAAVQLIPTYELVSLTQRAGGVTFDYASRFAYDPASFWTFLLPYGNGDAGDATYAGKGIFWEEYGYVGVVTFLLAAYATLRCRESWHVKFFALAAGGSYLLVLGPTTPAYWLVFHAVPGMKYFRFPTRLLVITDLSLIALASLGLTRLAAELTGRRLSRIPALAVVLTVADLLHAQLRQNPIADWSTWTRPPATAEILRTDSSLFRILCVGGNHAHRRTFQEAKGWEGDLQPFVDQREFIQPSSNVLYGLSSPNGYANSDPQLPRRRLGRPEPRWRHHANRVDPRRRVSTGAQLLEADAHVRREVLDLVLGFRPGAPPHAPGAIRGLLPLSKRRRSSARPSRRRGDGRARRSRRAGSAHVGWVRPGSVRAARRAAGRLPARAGTWRRQRPVPALRHERRRAAGSLPARGDPRLFGFVLSRVACGSRRAYNADFPSQPDPAGRRRPCRRAPGAVSFRAHDGRRGRLHLARLAADTARLVQTLEQLQRMSMNGSKFPVVPSLQFQSQMSDSQSESGPGDHLFKARSGFAHTKASADENFEFVAMQIIMFVYFVPSTALMAAVLSRVFMQLWTQTSIVVEHPVNPAARLQLWVQASIKLSVGAPPAPPVPVWADPPVAAVWPPVDPVVPPVEPVVPPVEPGVPGMLLLHAARPSTMIIGTNVCVNRFVNFFASLAFDISSP